MKCTVIITTFFMSLQSATSQLVHFAYCTSGFDSSSPRFRKISTWRADDFSKIRQNKK
jgi:hypothetical protein